MSPFIVPLIHPITKGLGGGGRVEGWRGGGGGGEESKSEKRKEIRGRGGRGGPTYPITHQTMGGLHCRSFL
jgi:hypothetical protein